MSEGAVPSTTGKDRFDECSIDRDIKTGDESYEYDIVTTYAMCLAVS